MEKLSLFERVWRSKSDEYVILKLLIELPIGLVLGVGKICKLITLMIKQT